MKKINSTFSKFLQTFKPFAFKVFSGGIIFALGVGSTLATLGAFRNNWRNGDVLSVEALNALVVKMESLEGDTNTLKTEILDLEKLGNLNNLDGKTVEAYLKSLKAKDENIDSTLNTLTAGDRISLLNKLIEKERRIVNGN
jgi:uncharacterized protein (UPF0335 family)